jgi:hypothetical protein
LGHCETVKTRHLAAAEWGNKGEYRALLEERRLPVVYEEDVRDWGRIGFAVAWHPPPGLLERVSAAAVCTILRGCMPAR